MTFAPATDSRFDPDRLSLTGRLLLAAGSVILIGIVVRPVAEAALLAASVVLLLYASLDRPTTSLPVQFLVAVTVVLAAFAVFALDGDDAAQFFRGAAVAVIAWLVLHVLHLLYPAGLERNEVLLASFAGFVLGWLGWVATVWGFGVSFGALGLFAAVLIARRSMRPEAMLPLGLFLVPSVLVMVLAFG